MKTRQSNIELLRIIAMFTVLMGHGCGMVIGIPSADEMTAQPLRCLLRNLISCATVGGVDVFVLISGWFGIHASRRGLGKFIYQIIFLLWGIYIVAMLTGNVVLDLKGVRVSMGIYDGYWFVMAYLGMYILSPILNVFAESATKKQFLLLLVAFYVFQCYYCWGWGMVNYFEGYSIVFFCGLYLTARYVRLYPVRLLHERPITIYLLCTIVAAVVGSIGIWKTGSMLRQARYDNPLVILAAVCVLVAFAKMRITSKIINRLALSSFAVYIIHFNPFVFPYFKQGAVFIANNYEGIEYALIVLLYFALVYVACSIIDWGRMLSWNGFLKLRSRK